MASRAEPPFVERPGRAADPELAVRRDLMLAAVASGRFATDPPARETAPGGVRALCFGPEHAGATLLHFHGGGLRLGCPEAVAPYAAALAARTGMRIICPAYRLAPEHPFPAALNDGWRAAATIEGPLIVAGDSAGGGVATSLTAELVRAGRPVAGLLLISPWLDLTITAATYDSNAATDPAFSHASAQAGAMAYLAGHAAADPRVSPLFADPAGFPSTFVSIGADEVLADDSRSFAANLHAAGVPVTLNERSEMAHAAVTRSLAMPGAAETFAAIVAFVEGLAR